MSKTSYQKIMEDDLISCIKKMCVQPVLFIGSGISRRYFNAPDWHGLLKILADDCPLIDKEYAYYRQTLVDPLEIGDVFSQLYQQWAWSDGRKNFPEELFGEGVSKQAYFKHAAAQKLDSITPKTLDSIPVNESWAKDELSALASIRPHAVITTNFDKFLEVIFPDYTPIVGQKIISNNQLLYGEIFKVHGCISESAGMILTKADFDVFLKKQKYLVAKMLTYFIEHPIIFLGYSVSDPNIKEILFDVANCVFPDLSGGQLLENIYIVERVSRDGEAKAAVAEAVIDLGEGRTLRTKRIQTSSFKWVYDAIGSCPPLESVNTKILRALLDRSYHLVRTDIPRKLAEVNFQVLEGAVAENESFARLFGITTLSNPSALSAMYPYTLSDVAAKVYGVNKKYWSYAQKLIDKVNKEKGIDIKENDNVYHCKIRTGVSNYSGKYSDKCVQLLKLAMKTQVYEIPEDYNKGAIFTSPAVPPSASSSPPDRDDPPA